MPESFIFLELTDPEINGLLYSIREIATGRAEKTNIHLTLRGPYAKPPPVSQLRRIERTLSQDVFFIGNPGIFRSDDESVVYLSVQHPRLRSVTWKPDFPIKKYGFNPHISLYVGKELARAEGLLDFLVREKIELVCSDFTVTSYVRKSPKLLEEEHSVQFFYPKLLAAGRLRADVLSRLSRALNRL